jgi:hypothetical protein
MGEVSPGRSLRFTASGRTQAEAKSAWVKKVEAARSGVVTDKISAAAYFDQWLKKKRGQVLKTTADRYEIVINNHLYRHFNGLLLADIRRSDIESLVALANGTVRAATIRHMVATISSILSSAASFLGIRRSESPWLETSILVQTRSFLRLTCSRSWSAKSLAKRVSC